MRHAINSTHNKVVNVSECLGPVPEVTDLGKNPMKRNFVIKSSDLANYIPQRGDPTKPRSHTHLLESIRKLVASRPELARECIQIETKVRGEIGCTKALVTALLDGHSDLLQPILDAFTRAKANRKLAGLWSVVTPPAAAVDIPPEHDETPQPEEPSTPTPPAPEPTPTPEPEPAETTHQVTGRCLIYNDVPIRDRDEMLNLTDMWRAAGRDPSKEPARWRKLATTEDFVDFVFLTTGRNSPSELFQSLNERGEWNTWAHWQIAFAYARYVNHEFHAWCNTVARERMLGIEQQRPAAQEMSEDILVAKAFQITHQKLLAYQQDAIEARKETAEERERRLEAERARDEEIRMREEDRVWAEKKIEEERERADRLAPDALGYRRLATSNGTHTLTEASKFFEVRRVYLIQVLIEHKFIYRQGGELRAYSNRLGQGGDGTLAHKYVELHHNDGSQFCRESVRITDKGLTIIGLILRGPSPGPGSQPNLAGIH